MGSLVRLDSGRLGKVIQANPADFTRPVLALLFHADGRPTLVGTVLDLRNKWEDDRIVEGLDSAAVPQQAMDGF